MADEIITPVTPSPAAPAVSAEPSSSPAPTMPVVDAAGTSPAAVAPVAAEATPAPEAPKVPAETVLVEPKVEPSLLAQPPEAPKPEEKKDAAPAAEAPVEPKKEEGNQSVEPAPLPTYEAFTVPEGITLDTAKITEFTKELGELQNLTKAEQKVMQEFGQKMVERHISELQQTVQRLNEHYVTSWEKQKSEWKDSFEKDPEIGGNRKDTTIGAALQFIKTHGGTVEQQKEFHSLMDQTGVGNHPAMIRMLAAANLAHSEGKPLPGTKPAPTTQSKVAKRYGNTQ